MPKVPGQQIPREKPGPQLDPNVVALAEADMFNEKFGPETAPFAFSEWSKGIKERQDAQADTFDNAWKDRIENTGLRPLPYLGPKK